MGWQTTSEALVEHADQFGAHDVSPDGGHVPKEPVVLGDWNDAANRLPHPSGRKVDERSLHGREQCVEGQQLSDSGFVEKKQSRLGGGTIDGVPRTTGWPNYSQVASDRYSRLDDLASERMMRRALRSPSPLVASTRVS